MIIRGCAESGMRRHQPNRVTRDIFGQNRGLERLGAICRAAHRYSVRSLPFSISWRQGHVRKKGKKTRNVLELKVGVLMFAVPAK
ncbi:hypothetical protein WN51_13455 [Melipona quadrifasciata]|uniref:Uncharacterized protein n=1 Tax=Melipona quadrifasciata TaxID=166423 RepID=A0A0N0U5D5_9HYME|nr:hypothetical protein WN51_13455 [Melipona quadrifasciata]